MRTALSLLIAFTVCAMPIATSAQAQAGKTLDIYYIDTEGGQATLYVSPSGQTLLVDAGNAGERDLNRILDVLKVAGVKQLDHFWLTHYHGDHYGSLIDISKQIPIKHLYDHGSSIEGDRPNIIKFQAAYAEFYTSIPRTIVKPGDKLAFTGTDTTAVMSDSVPLKTAIAKAPGAGRANPLCADHKPRDESKVDPDNHHSAGFVMNYGRFRTINLGDLTWSREFMLM
ncbi:MAG: MBL fold metallo-hydrolase, partial [Vicinamibacterales bacterium]